MRILALRALGLGDIMTAVPSLRALRRHHGDAHVMLASPAWLHPLLDWIDLADEHLRVDDLSNGCPPTGPIDLAVNLHGRGPQSHRWLMAMQPRAMLAFRHSDEPSVPGPAWSEDEHEVVRWCRLLAWSGIEADPDDLDIDAPPAPPSVADAVLVHPGAKDAARRWPPDRWAQVVAGLADEGARPFITGSASERELCLSIARRAGRPSSSVLAGRLDVLGLAGAVAAARLVISGDTGVAHLATALRRPSVTLFGPTPPSAWGPPPDRSMHRVIWHGRTGDPHGDRVFEGLESISVAEVEAEVRAARREGPPIEDCLVPAAGRTGRCDPRS
jgi:ADP-heptose:LPS heptosyltransferase